MTNGANSTVIACSGGGGSGSGFLGSFTTAPTANTTGDTYFNTADNTYYYYDGTTWQPVFTNNFLGNYATPPAGATAGSVYYNTTTNTLMVYNGTTWVPLSGDASMLGSFATAPTATITGDTYYNTTTNGYYRWDGASWVLQYTVAGGGADASNLGGFATAPTANKIGDTYFNTTDNGYYRWDGTSWVLEFTIPAQGLDATIAMNVATLPGGGTVTRPFSYRDTDEYSFVVMAGTTGVIITKTHVPTQTTQSITMPGPVGTTGTNFAGGVVLNGYTYIGIVYQTSGGAINNIYYVQNTANISTIALTTNVGLPNLGTAGVYPPSYIYSDGTDMYIANDGGTVAGAHVFRRASISAGTITSISTITYGPSATAFGTQAGVAFQSGYCHSHNGVVPGVLGVTTANYDLFNITGGASLFPPIPMRTASFPYIATNYKGDIYTNASSTSESTVPSTVLAKSIYNK